jgi:hypothetical protein
MHFRLPVLGSNWVEFELQAVCKVQLGLRGIFSVVNLFAHSFFRGDLCIFLGITHFELMVAVDELSSFG